MRASELARVRSDLIHVIRVGAEETGKMFTEPDEDWMPILCGATTEGKTTVVGLDAGFLVDDRAKDVLADQVLPQLIREREFVALGLVMSAWISVYQQAELAQWEGVTTQPSQDPRRTEILIVIGVDRYGDECYTATIIRHPQGPPTLEPWERVGGADSSGIGGRMIDPLRTALRPQG